MVKSSQNEETENEAQSTGSDDPEYQDQDHDDMEENDYDGNADLDAGKINSYLQVTWGLILSQYQYNKTFIFLFLT